MKQNVASAKESPWRVDIIRIEDNQVDHSVTTTSEEKAQKLEQAMLTRINTSTHFVSVIPAEGKQRND